MSDKYTHEGKEFGAYEKHLCLLLFLSTWPNAFSGLQFLITHYTPPFCCVNSNVLDQENNFVITTAVPAVRCNTSNSCSNNGSELSDQQTHCDEYQFEGFATTVSTEFHLVCNRAWIKPMLVSVYMCGKMIGGQLGGFMSDRFGRRLTFLLFTFLQYILAIITSFATSIELYAVCLFFSGGCAVVNFDAATLLGTESVHVRYRALLYFFVESGFAIGYMLMPLAGYLITDWRWFLRFSGFIGVLYIPYCRLIDETPTWLIAKGRREEAVILAQKVARINKHVGKLEKDEIKEFYFCENGSPEVWSTCVKTCKTYMLVGRLGIVFLAWVVVTLTWYAIALNNDNLSGNRLLNIFFAGVTELVSSVLYYFGLKLLGRRNTYVGLMATTGVAVATAPVVAFWSGSASLVITMLAKLTVAVCYNVIYFYTGELFPTNIRHLVLATSGALSRIGGIVAPFIIFAGESGDTLTTSFAMAAVVLVSGASYLMLPETKKEKLPQTIEDAVKMRQTCFTPCQSKKGGESDVESSTVEL